MKNSKHKTKKSKSTTKQLSKIATVAGAKKVLTSPRLAYALIPIGAAVLGYMFMTRRMQPASRSAILGEKNFRDGEFDAIDQANYDSFPASDAPAHY